MKTIRTMNELLENTRTLDGYLLDTNYRDYAINLIKRGTCFLVLKKADVYMFYPSRFIGYVGNTMGVHEANDERDGRETNKAIKGLLGFGPFQSPDMNDQYVHYCASLGFQANTRGTFGVERKFWVVDCL